MSRSLAGRERSFYTKARAKTDRGVKEHGFLRENEKLQYYWLVGRDGDEHGKVETGQVVKNLECHC